MKTATTIEIACVFSLSIITGIAVATHVFAWNYGMQDALGAPLYIWHPSQMFSFFVPFYHPWRIAIWWWQWGTSVPFMNAAILFGIGASQVWTLIWGVGRFRRKTLELSNDKFGKDAWGKESDLKKAGLLSDPPEGTILGKWGSKLISYNGDQHQLITGGSGSGKTHGPVISSLLTCRTSALVLDPKRTLYANTAKWRSTLGDCFYFDPTDQDSVCYNPLFEILPETDIAQSQNIAGILIDSSGLGKQSNPIWPIKAADLLTGMILYVLHHLPESQQNISHIRHLLSNEEDTYEKMAASEHKEVNRVGSIMLPLADKIRQSISITVQSALDVFADPLVVEKTSSSSFRISDLVCSENPVSFYMQVRASESRRLRVLQRLIMTQIKRAMMYDISVMPDGRVKKHKLTMVLEEFPALGKDEDFEYDLRQFREYGITAMIFCQSLLDIEAVYGRDQTILDNCHIVVCFAASNPRSLHDISTLLGKAVEKKVSVSRPRMFAGIFSGNQSIHHQRRPLMDEGEIREMSLDEQLIFVTGSPPFRTKKIRWFEYRDLAKRGTNLRKGGIAPGQSIDFLARDVFRDDDQPQTIVVEDTEPTPLHERVKSVLADRNVSQTKAAKDWFPETAERLARHWIAGTRNAPEWAIKVMEDRI